MIPRASLPMSVHAAVMACLVFSAPSSADDASPHLPTDQQILEMAISDKKVPPGFHTEDYAGAFPYYEHTSSVMPSAMTGFGILELCAEDYATAIEWSRDSARRGPTHPDLLSGTETEMYYEFRRSNPVRPTHVMLSRVHKCSYFVPASYTTSPAGFLGLLKKKPIDTTTASNFVQYYWWLKHYNIKYAKVVSIDSFDLGEMVLVRLIEIPDTIRTSRTSKHIEVIIVGTDFYFLKSMGWISFRTKELKRISGERP
jgi:hypothetical protein